MKLHQCWRRTAVRIAVLLASTLTTTAALAQPHYGMGHGTPGGGHGPMTGAVSMLTRQDAGSSADMALVHELLRNNDRIRRTVTTLPNGIRTITESDDPGVAQAIKAHVASMSQRLRDGREFNIFSPTLPVLFENRDKIKSTVETTAKGTIVTRTSTDAKVVAALQGHAAEVSELARDGMAAMHRGMMTRMKAAGNYPHAGMHMHGNSGGGATPQHTH